MLVSIKLTVSEHMSPVSSSDEREGNSSISGFGEDVASGCEGSEMWSDVSNISERLLSTMLRYMIITSKNK